MARLIESRPLLWAVLTAPALWLWAFWVAGAYTYGDVLSRSGTGAVTLMLTAAAVTPLRGLFSMRRWLVWLTERRGDIGLAAYGYVLLHALAYLVGRREPGLVLREAAQGWVLAGWVALLLFTVFAASGEDAAVRALRRSWRWLHRIGRLDAALDLAHRGLKRFHRIVYLGAALALLHWVLSAADPLTMHVQEALHLYGYYDGPIDGIIGLQSREALRHLQEEHGLPVTGSITPGVLDVLGIVPN